MLAALAAEDVLAADETPVNVLDRTVPAPAAGEDEQALDGLRERYDTAVASGIIHNRLRDRDTGYWHSLATATPRHQLTPVHAPRDGHVGLARKRILTDCGDTFADGGFLAQ